MVHLLLQSLVEGTLFLVFIVSNKMDSLLENEREKSHKANKSLSTMYDTVLKYKDNPDYWGYKYIRHLTQSQPLSRSLQSMQVTKLVFSGPEL